MKTHLTHWFVGLVLTAILSACTPIVQDPQPSSATVEAVPTLSLTLQSDSNPSRYEPIEFVIDGVPAVSNPFDASEVELQLTLLGPKGITQTVGGFWFQNFASAGTQPQGEGGWRARFTPTISGEWRASAWLKPNNFASNEVTFTVAESDKPGFVRVDPTHPRYFAFDNGTRFLPVGVNMGWWNDDPLGNYTRWLDHFAANGGNTIRVWMANWAFGLEWSDTRLGDYRPRMRQAWLLDELLRLADERGVKVILVLNHHGQFSKTVNPQWDDNPYNADLGGPLSAPEQFASDPTAMAFFQQRLRYIVDRWGAAPNLLAWEWWNEYNFTAINDSQMQTWLETMNPFLARRDPYDHLVTISGPAGAESPIWQMQGIDFVSVHLYTTNDPLHVASELSAEFAPAVSDMPDKPLLLAEFGFATGEETVDSFDKTGIHLHNGLWATLFSGQAGSGMYWWWNTYIEPLDLWYHFGALSTFMASLDPAQFTPQVATVLAETPKGSGAEGLLLVSAARTLLWVRSNQYTAASVDEVYNQAVRNAIRNKETLTEFVYAPTPLTALSVQLDNMPAGTYAIHWFDPQSGTWGESTEVEATDGSLSISVPTFSHDIAARIEPLP